MTPDHVLGQPMLMPCGATLRNRLAKSAMTEALGDRRTGAPTDELIRLYSRWSTSGAGLITTGNVMVDWNGRGEPGNVVIQDERHRAELRRWAEAAQAHGATLWMQLNHAGRQAPRRLSLQPVAPSAVPLKGFGGVFVRPRSLTDAEIVTIVAQFGTAAAVARDAGFGGVQVHAAHGYLVSQFLSPLTNLREDAWGGDPSRRQRFLLEVVGSIRAAVGPTFPVGVKLNSADFQRGGFGVTDAMDVARALEVAGVDLIEISGGTYERPAMTGASQAYASTQAREAYFLEYAQQIRSATAAPLWLTGGFRTAEGMAAAVASGAIDIVGLARPMAVEPEYPARILGGGDVSGVGQAPHVGVRQLDALLQVAWYQEQMHRMARGQSPDPHLGSAGVLWRAFWTNVGWPEPAPTPVAATE